ncbi:MAG TPA: anthranilate synthase component I family protein [Nitrospiria bacterium]|jgi:anthranilate/para-aminobenzoate synthase component I|nr:anthranilate synthase component I family protein [Nitrospiria bacterium]
MDFQTKERFLKSPHPGSLVKKLPWNTTTPVAAYERIAAGPYSFLLESVKGSKATARYSFVGTEPFLVLKTKGCRAEIHRHGYHQVIQEQPIITLNRHLNEYLVPKSEGLPAFAGGAVGFFSYDIVRFFEKLPRFGVDDLGCPDLLFMFTDTVIAFDHEQKTIQIIYTPPKSHILNTDRKELYEKGLFQIARIEEKLTGTIQKRLPRYDSTQIARPASNFTKDQYIKMVLRCKEYIAAGDIYQANLSQRFSVPFDQDPWLLYKVLRKINPSPFAGFLRMDDIYLVSASPERLIRQQGGVLETRPIAGTRPRGRTRPEDREMRMELFSNEKERAEHLMLVDLERNDLGKVCRYGSVRVDKFMVTERYSHVMHLVSNIRGILSPGLHSLDIIRAVFPSGTITGVPKVRCMEIIEELEPVVRGPYAGSFGYISFADELDLNLIIRTFVIKNGRAYIQVGGGIVADSEPEREYKETLYKAEALLRALSGLS